MKAGNYVVKPSGRVVVIDFNVMDRDYNAEDIKVIRQQMAARLAMETDKYAILEQEERKAISAHIRENIEQIDAVLDAFSELQFSTFHINRAQCLYEARFA
jgi:predicted unusual protein kinase regulating ubiquinone biosynthesis (AarF/ABC1/UbiB family)